jgi:hypothetical protein
VTGVRGVHGPWFRISGPNTNGHGPSNLVSGPDTGGHWYSRPSKPRVDSRTIRKRDTKLLIPWPLPGGCKKGTLVVDCPRKRSVS